MGKEGCVALSNTFFFLTTSSRTADTTTPSFHHLHSSLPLVPPPHHYTIMSLPESKQDITSLPESKQDADLAASYEARPGPSDAPPTTISSTNNESLSSSVKGSLDSIADPKPTTQSIMEQIPTAEGAAAAVQTGASSLIAGIGNLAFGVKETVAGNAADSHPESANADQVDDLHIPGAFEDETSDTEDIAAVKQSPQSAAKTLPSTQDGKASLPSAEAISTQIPGVEMPSLTNRQKKSHENTLGGSRQGHSLGDGTENINSVGVNSTTSRLAGQVPLEPRSVPQVVSDSQRLAGVSPGASSNTEAVLEKKQLERELKREVPESAISSAGSPNTGVPQLVTDSQRQAGFSPEAASNPEAVQDKNQLEQELKREVPASTAGSSGVAGISAGLDRGVPQIVADSQKKADASPEASANAEAIREKQQVERELKREVPRQSGADSTSVNLGETVSGGFVSAGAAIAGAATYARQKTHEATGTDPDAVLPESAQQAIDGEVTSGSTSRGPHAASSQQSTSQSITDTLTSGVTTASNAAANAVSYARQKTHEATGTDPVSVLPESAQQSIDGEVTAPSTGQQSDRDGRNVTDVLTGGAAAAGSAAAGAATYARQKTHEATGTDPVAALPASVQKNIDGPTSANDDSGLLHSSDSSFPRVPGHSHGLDLHSGVHNGVVGDHLDDDSESSHRSPSGSHSGHWQPGTSATVAHIPSLRDVDLSAGVKNTVVGSGADDGGDA